jgi:CxxC motif-containing protein (DUF1111 family)
MGSLGDGIVQGTAGALQMRAAPLWGLRYETTFLHGGCAGSADQAIRAHDGQGSGSRDSYLGLSQQQRSRLLNFLQGL